MLLIFLYLPATYNNLPLSIMDEDEFLGTLALLREQMQRDQTALKTSENVVQTISPQDLKLLQQELSHLKTAAREREQLFEASKQRLRSLESDVRVQGGSTEQLRAEATRLQTKVLTQAAACDAAEAAKVASEARAAALEERLAVAQVKMRQYNTRAQGCNNCTVAHGLKGRAGANQRALKTCR